jgi:16S rRNA U1498 N3-methylase RsmE
MNLLLLEEHELRSALAPDDYRTRHVREVLKAAPGDRIAVGIVRGPKGSARIRSLDTASGLRLDDFRLGSAAPTGEFSAPAADPAAGDPNNEPYPLTILLGHVRPIVLKRILKDLTTIGVDRILVFPGELGEKSYLQSTMWRDGTVRRQLIAGAEQAGVTSLPTVERFYSLARALESLAAESARGSAERAGDLRVMLTQRGRPVPAFLASARASDAGLKADRTLNGAADQASGSAPEATKSAPEATKRSRRSLICAVGPERGFTPHEQTLFAEAGFTAVSLGVRILRSETAVLLAAGMLSRALLQPAGNEAGDHA